MMSRLSVPGIQYMPSKIQDSTVKMGFFDRISAEQKGRYFSPKGWKRLVDKLSRALMESQSTADLEERVANFEQRIENLEHRHEHT